MSRVTAPASKLTRTLNAGAVPTHNAGAVLMPKYAELLRSRRSSEHHDVSLSLPKSPKHHFTCGILLLTILFFFYQSARGLTTTHRPTPQPSIAHRAKPLMQTFHSTAASAAPVSHLDTTRLPSLDGAPAPTQSGLRVPLLPDNYAAQHGAYAADAPVNIPEVTIVAADPSNVVAANALSEIEGIGLDGVELKFAHESAQTARTEEVGMLKDIWRGIVDDVLGPQTTQKTA
ncbi:hypothetical protein HJFPF1_03930 [Paramyrothecium foliicola]|nr:hypothetical protein HJFPF1_03930 [Paramyrothecium foliicola]